MPPSTRRMEMATMRCRRGGPTRGSPRSQVGPSRRAPTSGAKASPWTHPRSRGSAPILRRPTARRSQRGCSRSSATGRATRSRRSGLDLDIEADLGIDSIKRVEILGKLRDEFPSLKGFADSAELMDVLARARTLGAIVDRMSAAAAPADPDPHADAESQAPNGPSLPSGIRIRNLESLNPSLNRSARSTRSSAAC